MAAFRILWMIIILAICCPVLTVDLTLVPEVNGTDVVEACIAKISLPALFSSDEHLLRRIAYVETGDGTDDDSYTGSNSDGGIWQLSLAKYSSTKTVSSQLLQGISTCFNINWASTVWSDLRKPFYSAIAARLYLEVISNSIPLSTDISGQGSYWANYYTSSGGTQSDFVTAVYVLDSDIDEDCDVSGLDLFFVMDASGSVGYSNFQLIKQFVYDIVDSFEIDPDNVRVGVMSYGSSYTFHFYLNTYTTKSEVLSAVNSLPYSNGGTDTASALNAVRTIGFTESNGARPISTGIPRIAIVITDGKSNSYSSTIAAANALHNGGIIGFAIGIAGANTNELNAIASEPSYAAFISNFDSNLLSNLQVTISQEACVASPDLSLDDEISDTIHDNQTKYVNYPFSDDGITVQIHVTSGTAIVYVSTVISTPNEAVHDVMLETNGWEDAYIDPDGVTNPDCADAVYIAIESKDSTSTIELSVETGDNSTEPVTVTQFQSSISEYYGATLTVNCNAFGKPQPTIAWYKDGVILSSTGDIQLTQSVVNSTTISVLTITSLTNSNEGMFRCSGSNTLPNGTVTHSSSFTLEVTGIIVVNFTGIALSSTAIYLSWDVPMVSGIVIYHYIVEIDEIETNRDWTFHAVETYANIISLRPHYTYSCRVRVVGNETYPFNLPIIVNNLQAAPTSTPQNPSHVLFNDSSTSLNLTWYPPPIEGQNGIIQFYVIFITEVDTKATFEITSNYTYIYLDFLHAYYTYTFKIAAVTVEQGPFSSGFTLTMPEDAPTSPPSAISAIVFGPNIIELSWFPPPQSEQNGIIREYEIIIIEIESGSVFVEMSQNLSVSINYLHASYHYNITISAVTILNGPPSDVIFIEMPEDVPSSSPEGFVAVLEKNLTVYLSWKSPPVNDYNGILIGYQMTCIAQNGHTISLTVTGLGITVHEFNSDTHYTCTVCGFTSVGCGPNALTHISTYGDSPVGPPSSVVANTSATEILLQWEPPFDPESTILGYGIIYQMISTSSSIHAPRPPVIVHDIFDTSYVIESLLVVSVYKIAVFAITDQGAGPESEELIVETTETAIHAVEELMCLAVTSEILSCSWKHPETADYYVTEYQLKYRLADGFDYYPGYGEELGEVDFPPDIQYYDISGLLPYGGYIVELKSILYPVVGSEVSTDMNSSYIENEVVGISSVVNFTKSVAPDVSVKDLSVNIQSPTSVELSWRPPEKAEWKGKIDFYAITTTRHSPRNGITKRADDSHTETILFTPQANNPDPSLATEPLLTEQYLVEELEENFEYSFSVSIMNQGGTGMSSEPLVQVMPEAAPSGPPQNITVSEVTVTSITIMWLPPDPLDANGIITMFSLRFTKEEIQETTEFLLPADQLSFSKYGLHAYENISITIAAKTAEGWGPYSSLYSFFTLEEVPSSPVALRAELIGDNTVQLTWEPPESPNGFIDGYQITYTGHERSLIASGPFVKFISLSDKQPILIMDLVQGYFYNFKVQARNGAGYGTNSSVLLAIPEASTTTTSARRLEEENNNTAIAIAVPIVFVILVVILLVAIPCIVIAVRRRNKPKNEENFTTYDTCTPRDIPQQKPKLPLVENPPDIPLSNITRRIDLFEGNDYGITNPGYEMEIPDPEEEEDGFVESENEYTFEEKEEEELKDEQLEENEN